jgi:hypothetical protein
MSLKFCYYAYEFTYICVCDSLSDVLFIGGSHYFRGNYVITSSRNFFFSYLLVLLAHVTIYCSVRNTAESSLLAVLRC